MRAALMAVVWLGVGGLALQLVPRLAPPAVDAPAPVTESSPPAPPAPPATVAELADLLFPPPPALGAGSLVAPPALEREALIAWLTRAEEALSRREDPRLRPFVRWIAGALAGSDAPRPRTVTRPREADAIADGWQAAAAAAGWASRLVVEPRALWVPGDVAAPLWVAVDDGRGQFAARAPLTPTAREQVGGWTRVALSGRVVLYPPRRGRGLRLWVVGARGGVVATLGALPLVRAGGGALDLYDGSGATRRGIAQLSWRWQ